MRDSEMLNSEGPHAIFSDANSGSKFIFSSETMFFIGDIIKRGKKFMETLPN